MIQVLNIHASYKSIYGQILIIMVCRTYDLYVRELFIKKRKKKKENIFINLSANEGTGFFPSGPSVH